MRKLDRGIGAGAPSQPLVLGVTGMAAADSLRRGNAAAGPDGAASHDTSSTTGDHDGRLGLGIFGL